jgi:hypothetical protein
MRHESHDCRCSDLISTFHTSKAVPAGLTEIVIRVPRYPGSHADAPRSACVHGDGLARRVSNLSTMLIPSQDCYPHS